MNMIARYTHELERLQYARSTIRAYTSALRGYFAWLGQEPGAELRREELEAYLKHCLHLGRSRSHLDLTISALKILYVRMLGEPATIFEAIRPPKPAPDILSIPSATEIWQIADGIPSRAHRLAVLLIYGAGLQLNEVVALRVGDVDWAKQCIHVRDQGRGPGSGPGQARITLLHPAIAGDLSRYAEHREPCSPLLVGTGGRPLSPRAIRRSYHKSARRNQLRRFDGLLHLRLAHLRHQCQRSGDEDTVTLG